MHPALPRQMVPLWKFPEEQLGHLVEMWRTISTNVKSHHPKLLYRCHAQGDNLKRQLYLASNTQSVCYVLRVSTKVPGNWCDLYLNFLEKQSVTPKYVHVCIKKEKYFLGTLQIQSQFPLLL